MSNGQEMNNVGFAKIVYRKSCTTCAGKKLKCDGGRICWKCQGLGHNCVYLIDLVRSVKADSRNLPPPNKLEQNDQHDLQALTRLVTDLQNQVQSLRQVVNSLLPPGSGTSPVSTIQSVHGVDQETLDADLQALFERTWTKSDGQNQNHWDDLCTQFLVSYLDYLAPSQTLLPWHGLPTPASPYGTLTLEFLSRPADISKTALHHYPLPASFDDFTKIVTDFVNSRATILTIDEIRRDLILISFVGMALHKNADLRDHKALFECILGYLQRVRDTAWILAEDSLFYQRVLFHWTSLDALYAFITRKVPLRLGSVSAF
jgi:hypothetical protein